MQRRGNCVAALAALLALVAPGGAARAAAPAVSVARPTLEAGPAGAGGASGTVFFLRTPAGPAAAIGAAHNFDVDALARSGAVIFRLGQSGTSVARSEAFLIPPGLPFTDPGGSLAEDLVAFALDEAPAAVVLEPIGPEGVRSGDRVRVLGVPAMEPQDETVAFGTVSSVEPGRLEIDLDVPADLRGWGGAPVVAQQSGRVAGIVQAALPTEGVVRIGAAPLGWLLARLADPLREGRGEPFSVWAGPGGARAASDAPAPQARARGSSRSARSLLGVDGREAPDLRLAIDYPEEGAVFGGSSGAFVAGSARALPGDYPAFDVVIVLDTSASTAEPSGADVNGNGVVGERSLFTLNHDPGDSILAAEVEAARRLLATLDPSFARVGVVTFAGEARQMGFSFGPPPPPPAITEQPLTTDYRAVDTALQLILARGPAGMTHMSAGVDQATKELVGLPGALSEGNPKARKVVFFLTDGQPTLPVDGLHHPENVASVLRAAQRGRKAHVEVHTFAIGPEALSGPIAPVELADLTGGVFTPVRHPADIVPAIETVNLARIDEVTVTNDTTGEEASELIVGPDGSWSALVPLAAGKNRVVVVARSTDGLEERRELEIQHAPDAELPPLPPTQVGRRNELLQRRLLSLQREGEAVDRERAERTRRELRVEIERERAAARERAAEQRKELRLEVEPRPDEPEAEPPEGGDAEAD